MHRMILGLKNGDPLEVDHKDRNGLNNCRRNLRRCTHSENLRNQTINLLNTSGYKGVHWCKEKQRWTVYIKVLGVRLYRGRFKTIEEAIEARLKAVKKFYGVYYGN